MVVGKRAQWFGAGWGCGKSFVCLCWDAGVPVSSCQEYPCKPNTARYTAKLSTQFAHGIRGPLGTVWKGADWGRLNTAILVTIPVRINIRETQSRFFVLLLMFATHTLNKACVHPTTLIKITHTTNIPQQPYWHTPTMCIICTQLICV